MTLFDLTDLLRSGGPWALVAALGITVTVLARYIKKLVEDCSTREKERNAQMLRLLEARIEADIKHEQAFKNMAKAFERVADRL